jgi:SAM-dependent methyltransferase
VRELFKKYWKIKSYGNEVPEKIPVLISSGDPFYEATDHSAPQLILYFKNLGEGSKILDVGAGNKHIEIALRNRDIKAKYFSMDTAKRDGLNYDFENLETINEKFDLIIMQEVLEHLPLETGYQYLKKSYDLLNESGFLVVTIPNTRKPVWFRDSDFTHIQSYPVSDLYGLLRVVGFSGRAEFRRIEIRNRKMNPKQKMILVLRKFLFRVMGFDYAHGILIKIQKN